MIVHRLKQISQTRVYLALSATMLLVIPAIWVTSAYAAQLSLPPVEPIPIVGPTRPAPDPMVSRSQLFPSRWLNTVKATRERLVWSSYPASIRGQIFSGQVPGNDPMRSGGW